MSQVRISTHLSGKLAALRVPLPAHEIAVRAGLQSRRPDMSIAHLVQPLERLCDDLNENLSMTVRQRRRARSILVDWVVGSAQLTESDSHEPLGAGHTHLIVVTGISPSAINAVAAALLTGEEVQELRVDSDAKNRDVSDSREALWSHEDRGDAALMASGFVSFAPENRWHVPSYYEFAATSELAHSTQMLVDHFRRLRATTLSASASYLERLEDLATLIDTTVVIAGLGTDRLDQAEVDRSISERAEAVVARRSMYSAAVDSEGTRRYVQWRMRQSADRHIAHLEELKNRERHAGRTDVPFFYLDSTPDRDAVDAILESSRRGSGPRNPS